MKKEIRKRSIILRKHEKYKQKDKHFFAFCKYPFKRRILDLKGKPVEIEENIVREIDGEGMVIEREKFISPFEKISMEIDVPIQEEKVIVSVCAGGEITWVKKIENNNCCRGSNKYQIGIKFNDIRDEDRQNIIKCVKKKKIVSNKTKH